MYTISKYLGIESYIYSEEDLYNYYLCDIKKNLKPTKTLKKVFYIPTKNEIQNKHFMIHIKNKPKINTIELINAKKNLNKLN
jgi:Fe-S cluster assembly scaffold protein SufB